MKTPRKLYTPEFITINVIMLFAFFNIAVFYSFYNYLGKIGIPAEWKGIILGLEPMAAFFLRPLVISRLHARNAPNLMTASLLMLVAALISYVHVVSIPGLILLRIFHGAVFVLLVSAAFTLVVNFIPGEKSAQGFSVTSLSSLIPYAVMPPVTEWLLRYTNNEAVIYAGMAVIAVPAIVLLLFFKKRILSALMRFEGIPSSRPTMADVRDDLGNRDIVLLFGVNFFVYISHAMVFFFMKDFSIHAGMQNVGAFFSIYTAVMIAVRLIGGKALDRLHKLRVLAFSLLALAICLLGLSQTRSPGLFFVLAACYGLCIGVGIPMLNAAVFTLSPPHYRGLNTNLSLFMMDAGFFLGPYLGGALVAAGWGIAVTLQCCVVFLFLGFGLACVTMSRQARASGRAQPTTDG